MKLTPISKALDNPVAKRVYDQMMAMAPEAAVLYAQMVVSGALVDDLTTHQGMIQKRVDDIVAKRVATLSKSIKSSYISKVRSGGDGAEMQAVADIISKAGFDFTEAERRKFAEGQARDAGGRFRTMNRKIDYSNANRRLNAGTERHLKIPETNTRLSNTDRAHYQQAYLQVRDALSQFKDAPTGAGVLHFTRETPRGEFKTDTMQLNVDAPDLGMDANWFSDGGRLREVGVAVDSGINVQGAAFNLLGALGTSPYAAGRASLLTEQGGEGEMGRFKGADRAKGFAEDWNKTDENDAANPGSRIFRRLNYGSVLLQEMAGKNVSPQMKLALKTGQFVGQYGPEAQKVIGPHADRAAYRYRGVEKTPDATLQANIDAARARFGGNTDAARDYLIYGSQEQRVGQKGRITTEAQPSPLIRYFAGAVDPRTRSTVGGKLHNPDLAALQRSSGVIPPSEGIIIDRKGKVVTQAVGYGDDWYLPFNLKTMSKLKGGEYIRTRTWGGLTTEDIYAGLLSGARAVTVISHNGVYTVEFDDSLRGSRRYNDKAARMVKRYGHLLDAVKSKEVTLSGIPDDRLKELEEEVSQTWDKRRERKQWLDELEVRKKEERHDPQMSAAAKTVLAETFVEEYGQPTTASGEHLDWIQIAEAQAAAEVANVSSRMAAEGTIVPVNDLNNMRQSTLNQMRSPEDLIERKGLQPQWAQYFNHAQAEYKAKQSPLNLDGSGYDKSQLALQEQFPYYISRATWQPRHRGSTDHGYIKPRYTRPEGALAGYYDPSIAGYGRVPSSVSSTKEMTGKVTADQTRYQNPGYAKVVADRKTEARKKEEEKTASFATDNRSPDRKIAQENAAVISLWEKVHGMLSDGTTYHSGALAGKPISAGQPDIGDKMPFLFKKSKEEVLRELARDKEATTAAVLREFESLRAYNIVSMPTAEYERVKNPTQAAKGEEFDFNRAMSDPEQIYDLGEQFAEGRKAVQYQAKAKELLADLRIEPNKFDDAGLDAELNKIIADAKSQMEAESGLHIDEEKIKRTVRNAVGVKTLKKRYARAVETEAQIEAQRQAAEAARIRAHVVQGRTAEEILAQLQSAAQPQPPNRTITGESERQ